MEIFIECILYSPQFIFSPGTGYCSLAYTHWNFVLFIVMLDTIKIGWYVFSLFTTGRERHGQDVVVSLELNLLWRLSPKRTTAMTLVENVSLLNFAQFVTAIKPTPSLSFFLWLKVWFRLQKAVAATSLTLNLPTVGIAPFLRTSTRWWDQSW